MAWRQNELGSTLPTTSERAKALSQCEARYRNPVPIGILTKDVRRLVVMTDREFNEWLDYAFGTNCGWRVRCTSAK